MTQRQVIVPLTGLLSHRPYSPAVLFGSLLFVSGHTGSDPVTREFEAGIDAQTRQALVNIRSVVEAAGGRMSDIGKVNVFMVDMQADFDAMNTVFREFFPVSPPARTTVGVSHLARRGLRVEIDAVAVVSNDAGNAEHLPHPGLTGACNPHEAPSSPDRERVGTRRDVSD